MVNLKSLEGFKSLNHKHKKVSFIIPVLNEEKSILKNLSHYLALREIKSEHIVSEVIFVDGGSTDRSLELLRENNFEVVVSEKGRSKQLNNGAQNSSGDVVIFLHADTKVPECIERFLPAIFEAKWGFFKLTLSGRSIAFKMISFGINFRSKLFGYASGDQVIFFERSFFCSMGGYANIPLMEDIEITRRARKLCKPYVVQESVVSSSRRWEKNGIIKTIFFMWFIQLCYVFGVNTRILARWYYPQATSKLKVSRKRK